MIRTKMWTLCLTSTILSVIQIHSAAGCTIQSVTSPSASSLNVVWDAFPTATAYRLEFRVINSSNIAPVILTVSASYTQKLVYGLRPGHRYEVQLTVRSFMSVLSTCKSTGMTVPDVVQITAATAASSSSIKFQWAKVVGAENYTVHVEQLFSSNNIFSQTFTTLSGEVTQLEPSATYTCYIIASNSAGNGAKGSTRTITTLVPPPDNVNVTATGKTTATVTWTARNGVLMYKVTVTDSDPSNQPVVDETSSTSMLISNLEPCSNYTVGVSSLDSFLIPGEPSEVSHITSNINSVTTVTKQYNCTTATVTVTWDLVFGATSYMAKVTDGTGESLNCTSASTNCDISALKCGEKYTVEVTAISDDCHSTYTLDNPFDTVPCAPANPVIEYTCSKSIIIYKWEATNNTLYYVAKSTGKNLQIQECRTQNRMCYYTDVGCGETYTFTVQAISKDCNSETTEPKTIKTAPCLPQNIQTSTECTSDKLTTSWDAAAGAQSYTLMILGNTNNYNCTTQNTSCEFDEISCGEHLSVTVTASNENCTTQEVLGEVAETAPCPPTNVSISNDCSLDTATVNWVPSKGVVYYLVTAEDSSGIQYSCSSFDPDCDLESLKCGETYSVSVIGSNFICNSSASANATFQTASCPPSNVVAERDCSTNGASITWDNHQATGSYKAVIKDSQSGDMFNCTSNTVNSCIITAPPCGRTYSVTVTYNYGNCSSTSTAVSMDSVPCQPENVAANVTCITGELTVTWTSPAPEPEYMTKISGGTPSQTIYCNSTKTQCIQTGLNCGSSYMLTVYSVSGSCLSLPSSQLTVQTIPCAPSSVSVQKACSPNHSNVSWASSAGAAKYIAEAVSVDGTTSKCESQQTSCSFSSLQCGQVYTISVSGVNDSCAGPQSSNVSLKTEPCSPVNVTSQLDCQASTAEVSWAASANAANYSVTATSSMSPVYCHGTDTNCILHGLDCNVQQTVTVTASDEMCTSDQSAPFNQDPVPCAPQNVQTSLTCSTNDAVVSWDEVSVSWEYNVTAVSSSGQAADASCTTSSSNCTLNGLECGQNYTVTVIAFSGSCVGPTSNPITLTTAPCGVANLTTDLTCGSNTLDVSMSAVSGASSYTVTVSGPNGFSTNCTATTLTCQITGLQCATQYNINAVAKGNTCNSPPTQAVVTTGPCDPTNVNSALICSSDSATVSWNAAPGADAYTVKASEAGSQYETSCRNNTPSCQLNQLHCGKNYTLTVVSEGATCNSTGTIASLTTAPCSPTILYYNLTCGTNSSSLTWTSVQSATGYVVNATTASGDSVSCTSATSECMLTALKCSQNYTATVIAQGNECKSEPSTGFTIGTAPCPPSITSTQYTCSSSTASISWSEPGGSIGFYAEVVGNHADSCDTTSTSCEFQNIPCDLNLHIKVKAKGPQCDSEDSIGDTFESVPCAPENVSATLVCDHNSAMVTWTESSLAVNYTVTATGPTSVSHCHNVSTSCTVQDMQCGEEYNIAVTSHSATCTGLTSDVHTFKAGLCAPASASVSPGCQKSTVNWSDVPGAEKVVATSTNDNGQTYTCESDSSHSCDFSDLPCGGNYSVTVLTVDRGCNSASKYAGQLKTVQCPLTNLDGTIECGTNAVTLTWDQSSVPGSSYSVKRELIGNGAGPDVFTSSANTYTMNDLQCGETYNFSVAADDGKCLTSYSTPIQISTAACEPTTFTAQVDCGSNNGTFSWAEGKGASSYIVQVTGEHRHEFNCSSNTTTCVAKLDCGRFYSATLVAFTDTCSITKSTKLVIESAPCLPENIEGVVDCSTNVMNVTWKEMPIPENYTAWAISTDGHNASCTSKSNFCSISDLECGRVYGVVVSASSIDCKVIVGSDYKVQSAPCKPESMNVNLNCSANAVTVSWTQLNTNQNNTVTATSDSDVSTCQTQNTSCSFLNLSCGTNYTFTAVAQTNVCMSENSTMDTITAPCAPTAVSAKANCGTNEAVVFWNSTGLVESYSVQAKSSAGHSSSCTDTSTTCSLPQLLCGQEYTVSVEAVYKDCTGPASASTTFVTEPCVPVSLTATYTVGVAQVTWVAAKGAASYLVEAVADQGTPTISNTSTSTQCALTGLLCGKTYNITATAHNEACDLGVTSEQIQLTTEPCPPTNVQANMQCDQHNAIVSWTLSDNAVGYTAFLQNENNHKASCNATSTESSCEASGLECGTVYTVYAVAKGNQIDSFPSNETSVATEPCQPSNINVIVDCEAKAATVSWQPSDGAQSYITGLRSSNHTDICSSNTSSCQPSHLHCGEEYNVSVTAVGERCNTTGHMASNFYTEPCVATGVSVNYTVGNAVVHWNVAQGATSYSVEAVSDQGAPSVCNSSTSTQCTVSGLQCSKLYNVTVSAHNQACESQGVASAMVQLTTEPCPPSNIQATVACQPLEATISWSQSNFAVGYVAYINNTQGAHCDAAPTDTSCVISGLDCDLVYSAWVIAKGEQYNSSESTVISFVSAPCSPQDIQVNVDCSSDGGATVSWNAPVAANFSVTSVVDGNPQTLCTTQQTSCALSGLSCGQRYHLSLTATNEQCSVTALSQPTVNTRPCSPQNVNAILQCGTQTANVTWDQNPYDEQYTVYAIKESDGEESQCNSTSSDCQFTNLTCGQSYNFTIKALSNGCQSQSSSTVYTKTAPCVPTNIDAEMDCTTDSAAVSWTASSGAENYTVTGQSTTNNVTCETSDLTCSLTNLTCGTQYTIHVVARDSTCSNAPSQAMTLDTAPCPPENVDPVIACETNSLTISWNSSAQAQHYVVSVTAQNGGSNEMCNTTESFCTLNSVSCGNTFVVQVTSVRGSCQSQPSQTASVVSKPCKPSIPLVLDSCVDAKVSWAVSPVADMYRVVVVGDNGHMHTCNTTFNNCTLSPLHCEQHYSVSVTAWHETCSSLASPTATLTTGPCKPDNVTVTYDCHKSSALLTWNKKSNAVDYSASAVDDDGTMLYCHSNSSNCSFEGLQCGRIYNFTVLATAGTCNSSYSDPVDSVGAVPCPPENVTVQLLPLQDDKQFLSLSWSASKCSNTEYLVKLTGNLMGDSLFQFDISSYWTLDTYFELPLPCSSEYNAAVEARNSAGTSGPSIPVSGETAEKAADRRRRDLADIV